MSKTRFEGEEVEAIWEGDGSFYGATVEAVNEDGTYNILFDDGEKQNNVREEEIRDRGLMTPSSSSEGFADEEDLKPKKATNKKTPPPKKPEPKKRNPSRGSRNTSKVVSAEVVQVPKSDAPALKRSSSATETNDFPPIKKPKRSGTEIDKWDGITSIIEMRKEARALEASCKQMTTQRDQDRAYILCLQKQVLARDKVLVNQLLPQQIAQLLKEDLAASLEFQMHNPGIVLFQFQQVLTEEAFGQIVEEVEKIQGPSPSIFQLSLAPPTLLRFFGKQILEGLTLKFEYNETHKIFRATGPRPIKP